MSTVSIANSIPHEIWLRVAWFIPQKELQCLYPVNRHFLEISLNERYRAVTLRLLIIKAARILFRLRDPFIGKRVRSLVIILEAATTHVQCSNGDIPETKRVGRLEYIKHIIRPITLRPQRPQQLSCSKPGAHDNHSYSLQFVVDLFSSLSGVTEYKITSLVNTSFQPVVSIIANFPGLFKNLRKLSLYGPITILPSSNLLHLEELEITLLSITPLNDMVHFICRFQSTLRRLCIQSWIDFAPSAFFGALVFFPNLSKLDIRLQFTNLAHDLDPTGVARFLNLHASTLRHILCHLSGSGWRSFDLFANVDLPFLESLELGVGFPNSNAITRLTTLISRFADTLTALVIVSLELSFEQVCMITDIFSNRHRNQHLKVLKLTIIPNSLTLQVIGLLVERFPRLLSLQLSFCGGTTCIPPNFRERILSSKNASIDLSAQEAHHYLHLTLPRHVMLMFLKGEWRIIISQ